MLSLPNKVFFLASSVAVVFTAGAAFAQSGPNPNAAILQSIQQGRYAEVEDNVNQALARSPQDPQLRFFKGIAAGAQGRTNEAIDIFTKLTEEFPLLPEPYNNLATLYAAQGNLEKARSMLEQAINTNPSYQIAFSNLRDVNTKLASQAYQRALQLEGNGSTALPKLALLSQIIDPGAQARMAAAGVSKPVPRVPVVAQTPKIEPLVSKPTAAPVGIPAATSAQTPKPNTSAVVATTKLSPTAAVAAATATVNTPPQASPAPAAGADEQRNVRQSVDAWARAWEGRNMNGYFASYADAFKPGDGSSRSNWEQQRRDRIMGKNKIDLSLSNVTIAVKGEQATVKFQQNYRADGVNGSGTKTLEMVKSGSTWKIVRETM